MPIYVADTNFFVQAHRMHYPMDIVPGFWRKVVELAERGILISIDKVKDEMLEYRDGLSTWIANDLMAAFFKDTSSILTEYARVTGWAMGHAQYTSAAKAEFCDDKIAELGYVPMR